MTFLSRFRYDLPPPPAPPTVVTKPLDTSSELGGGVGSVGNGAEMAEAEDSDDSGHGQEEPHAAAEEEEEEASDPPPAPAAGSRSLMEELQDTHPPVPHTQEEYQKSDDYMDSRADM